MSQSKDFNDLHVENGLDAVRDAIIEPVMAHFGREAEAVNEALESENRLLNPPPVLDQAGYLGILKEVCEVATRSSEASPVAVAANFLAMFSAIVGRSAFQHIGDGVCHARPFFLLSGRTGKARKGTSEYTVFRIFKEVEALLAPDLPTMKRHEGGLSTGEGLGWEIHDDIENEEGEIIEAGTKDKRLYVVEPEFAGAMAVANREKNTLSAYIRNAWDGRDLGPLVRHAKWKATEPHIVITGHITASELVDKMTAVDAQSGFMNRFIILYVVRPKLVPLPKRTPDDEVKRLASEIVNIIRLATDSGQAENNGIEIRLSKDAVKFWCSHYKTLTQEHEGYVGALLVRTEIYCRMLAMIFALLDQKLVIEPEHIQAALAWINYWRDSVQYIFSTIAARNEQERLTERSNTILEFIRDNHGCTRTDITKGFKNKLNADEITTALNELLNAAPPLIRQETKARADGKPGKGVLIFWPL